jgi:hypothetical protein
MSTSRYCQIESSFPRFDIAWQGSQSHSKRERVKLFGGRRVAFAPSLSTRLLRHHQALFSTHPNTMDQGMFDSFSTLNPLL